MTPVGQKMTDLGNVWVTTTGGLIWVELGDALPAPWRQEASVSWAGYLRICYYQERVAGYWQPHPWRLVRRHGYRITPEELSLETGLAFPEELLSETVS